MKWKCETCQSLVHIYFEQFKKGVNRQLTLFLHYNVREYDLTFCISFFKTQSVLCSFIPNDVILIHGNYLYVVFPVLIFMALATIKFQCNSNEMINVTFETNCRNTIFGTEPIYYQCYNNICVYCYIVLSIH